jgi:putative oxidoreductase
MMSLEKIAAAFEMQGKVLEIAATPFLLFVRLYWGYAFMADGWGKLHNLAQVTEFFAGLGIPAPGVNALMVALTQLVCGGFLLVGLGARIFTVPLVVCMTMAFLTSDFGGLQSLWLTEEACKASTTCVPFEEATPFSFWMASCIVLLFGPGLISADAAIAAWWKARSANPPAPSPVVTGAAG